MDIQMHGAELFYAVEHYIKIKYGLDIKVSESEFVNAEIREWKPKYLKDAKDKYGYLRDEKGCAILDPKKKHYIDHRLSFGDSDHLIFHIDEGE
jgi:hypothetical protein|tara:strand:- start:272 stop:553 length:282 start_codon:yes stop_codon:yes gene_type:complete